MPETPGRPPAPLLVFSDDWGRHPSSCQHLTRHLLGRHRVEWINTIGTRPPRLDATTLIRRAGKLRQWAGRADRPAPLPAGLEVRNPIMWPWFGSGFARRMNRTLLLRQLAPILKALPDPAVAVATIPLVADLIGELPVARWVYYCVDDFAQWPGLDRAALAGMEERMVARADVIVAVSEALTERIAGMGREAHLLTHGVDLEHLAGGGDGPAPPQLEGLPRPLILFWGMIDRRMDSAFLRRLADDLTGGTILLVGPSQDPDPALGGLARLVRLPPLPYEQLPGLAREAAVLIMPYADLPVTRAMQPLKLKEYLATGRPVVVSDLPATRPWSDCLDLADTPGSFSAAVRSRVASGLPEPQRAARARLSGEGWGAKATAFERWAFGPSPAPEVEPCVAASHGRPDGDG